MMNRSFNCRRQRSRCHWIVCGAALSNCGIRKVGVLLMLATCMLAPALPGCGRGSTTTTEDAATVDSPAPLPPRPASLEAGEAEVNLQNQTLADEQVEAVANNRSLRRLRLSGTDIDDRALARLITNSRLELLDIVDCVNLTPAAMETIGSITTLRNLRLSGSMANDQSMTQLTQLNELAAILLQRTDVTDQGITVLGGLPKLKEINLFGTAGVTDRSWSAFAKLPALEKLRLRATGVTGENAVALASMRDVTELDLSETSFGNAGMAAVAAMPALKQLNLWLTSVDDAGIEQLRDRTDLTSLNLDNVSGITDASLEVIENMHELTFLHLGGTSVTGEGLQRLQSLTKLRTLVITRLGLTPAQVETIRQRMPWVTKLEVE